jgi:hypothetical protein
MSALSAAELAPPTPQTLLALEAKHPAATLPLPDLGDALTGPTIEVDSRGLLRALRRSPRASSGGPSGWTFDHLRQIVGEDSDTAGALVAYIQDLIDGRVTPSMRDTVLASRLIPLQKPASAGGGVRPIAVGEIFLRLTSRWACSAFLPQLREALLPLQFGVGESCGAEQVVRVV